MTGTLLKEVAESWAESGQDGAVQCPWLSMRSNNEDIPISKSRKGIHFVCIFVLMVSLCGSIPEERSVEDYIPVFWSAEVFWGAGVFCCCCWCCGGGVVLRWCSPKRRKWIVCVACIDGKFVRHYHRRKEYRSLHTCILRCWSVLLRWW